MISPKDPLVIFFLTKKNIEAAQQTAAITKYEISNTLFFPPKEAELDSTIDFSPSKIETS